MKDEQLSLVDIIMLLKKLEAGMPDDLWLFVTSNNRIYLMTKIDNQPVMTDSGYDQNCIQASFTIPCDAGDF